MSPFEGIRQRLGRGGEPAARVPRPQRKAPSNFRIGAIALVIIAIGTYFGFAKALPFGGGYKLKATFANASNIKPNSPVRIAGVNVGTVTGTEKADDSDATVVEMEIQDEGLPIHQDAELKIRPRIFLEGNFFVDLSPGTPSAPELDSGSTVSMSQTATSVQLDELLTALQRPTRGDLQALLQEFSKGLADGGAEGLNGSFKYSGDAFKNGAVVSKAFQGEQRNDLSKLIRGQQRVSAALDRNEVQLKDLITNFNITTAALASQSANLTATVRELPRVLAIARPALFNLNVALPPTTALAKALIPGLKATPATIDAAIDSGWIDQTRKLLSQQELQGLAQQLQPTTADLASTTASAIKLLPQANNVALCFSKVLLPAGDIKIQANNGYPANLVSGAENYKEFWYSMVGLSGEGAAFDGNGQLTRFQTGGGATQYVWGKQNQTGDEQFANGLVAPIASRPAYPGKLPQFKSDVPCYKNPLPNVNSAQVRVAGASQTISGGGSKRSRKAEPNPAQGPLSKPLPGVDSPQQPAVPKADGGNSVLGDLVGLLNPFGEAPVSHAIRKHLRDFIAILVMIVLALVVGLFILGNQRFYLPGWVPLLGKDFYTIKAEFRSAQSVTPGQGQTVNIAGVPIGDITDVQLEDGRAVVTMKVQRDKYDDGIYQDATMLLRPRTGLNDMFIQLDPGTPAAGKLGDSATIAASNTAPNVNPDEILAALDTDTRQYLKLLIGSGAEGLRDNGENLRAVFARLEPTNRDIARITTAVAKRRRNLSRLINRFQLLANEVAKKDRQLSELVDASNAVFQAFASQDRALAEAVRLLPGALTATEDALRGTNVVAANLGPAARKLLPGALALPKTLRQSRPFFRETVDPIKNQIRPFSIDVQPTVKTLRPAAHDLAQAAPHLTNTFKVLNFLLNELAYNPPGSDEGFLFWVAWGNHNAASLFSATDAGGPIRRGVIGVSCTNLATLQVAAQSTPSLRILVELLNAPTKASTGCP